MMKTIRKAAACAAFAAGLFAATPPMLAQEWLDVTEGCITNPTFDNNSSDGWTIEKNSGGRGIDAELCEFWQGTFDMKQTFAVPNGKYRVSVNAYYRTGSNEASIQAYKNGTEAIPALLYANSASTAIASLYSEHLTTSYDGCWSYGNGWANREYYPNTMESASYCFSLGMYRNSLEFDVTDGTATIGVKNDAWTNNNWCIMDNFKLEYYGTKVTATSVSLDHSTLELLLGETARLTATLLPENTTYKKLTWASTDESVATVDANGQITTLKEGAATISATTTDGSNKRALCRLTVTRNGATAEAIVINEIMAANVDMFIDPSCNYGGWIELYNPTDHTVSAAGFYVSDDPANLKMCRIATGAGIIPAHGYSVLWFDNYSRRAPLQLNMKLNSDGGAVYIADQDGNLLTSQQYPAAISRTSYARTADGGAQWGYTAAPTPGATNAASPFATSQLDAPVVDKDAQLFEGTLQVGVYIPAGTTLRYTTDGSTPTPANGETSATGLFSVSSTTVFRFRLFADGMLPSAVTTRSYILRDRAIDLPVISVVGDNKDLYGDDYGIFVRGNGKNGFPGKGQSAACNWNADWEHPVNFEYLVGGTSVFSQEAHITAAGGWSRAWEPHSFKIKANKVYDGKKYLDYPFFAAKPYLRHKVLLMRNGGNDNAARFIDPALQEIIQRSGIDIDGQCYQPTVHYINGKYIGVINMREPNNKHFGLANFGLDTDLMDQFEMSPDSGYVQKAGDKEVFSRWYELSGNAADDETYAQIRRLVDIDEFINYMAVELYLGGTDFPQNNVKGYRPRTEDGRYRFVCFDLDLAFNTDDPFGNFFGKQVYTFNSLYDTTDAVSGGKNLVNGNQVREEIEIVTMFLNMLQNDRFRKQFIDTYCLVAGAVFEPTRCGEILDELYQRVLPSMQVEGKAGNLASSYSRVKNRLNASRQNTFTQKLQNRSEFRLSGTERQRVRLSTDNEQAQLFVNDLQVPANYFDGYLFAPATLSASAPAGYRFAGWKDLSGTAQSTTLFATSATWSYYDKGSLDGTDWKSSVSAAWSTGSAPLGFDTNNTKTFPTQLEWGTDARNKRPTYYFARSLALDDTPGSSDTFTLNWLCDDGFVIYVNGTEAGRFNMPDGTPTFETYATQYAPANPESGSLTLPSSLFRKGGNTIAVEVHNCDAKSSDIYWDAALTRASAGSASIVSTDPELTLPNGTLDLMACYEPLGEDELAATDTKPVKVNEVSAANDIYVNEYFKRNDWIELYNTTDEDIDVAGMYLSDNVAKPKKYQIPEAPAVEASYTTLLPAHGFLVVWCDKLAPISQIHTSFKLGAEGGDVLLTAADEAWCDTLSYVAHNGQQTAGLYPDGGSDTYLMSLPTIGKPNRLNSYCQAFEEPKHPDTTGMEDIHISRDGGLAIAYDGDALLLRSDEPTDATLRVHAASGVLAMQSGLRLNGTSLASVAHLPAGIYVARLADKSGNAVSVKFARK